MIAVDHVDHMIPKKDLVHGAYYAGRCRNALFARWNANDEVFYHWQHECGFKFVERIKCPEDEPKWDVFVAELEITPPEEIPFTAN